MWNYVWNPGGLPKVNIFNWILVHDRLLTADNLQRGLQGGLPDVSCAKHLRRLVNISL